MVTGAPVGITCITLRSVLRAMWYRCLGDTILTLQAGQRAKVAPLFWFGPLEEAPERRLWGTCGTAERGSEDSSRGEVGQGGRVSPGGVP